MIAFWGGCNLNEVFVFQIGGSSSSSWKGFDQAAPIPWGWWYIWRLFYRRTAARPRTFPQQVSYKFLQTLHFCSPETHEDTFTNEDKIPNVTINRFPFQMKYILCRLFYLNSLCTAFQVYILSVHALLGSRSSWLFKKIKIFQMVCHNYWHPCKFLRVKCNYVPVHAGHF